MNKPTIKKIKLKSMIEELDPAPAPGGQSFDSDSDHRSPGHMRTSSKLENSKYSAI